MRRFTGGEFHRVNFSYAVQNGLLTDYKVLILTVEDANIPRNIRKKITDSTTEFNFDDSSKLIGLINGLSKKVQGDGGRTWDADPCMMHRAVAFCSKIGNETKAGSSKYTANILPKISKMYEENLSKKDLKQTVSIATKHIDGSMNSQMRNQIMQWLSEKPENERECRVVTNVHCLSEGVDVPSLDAVLFLSARNSQIEIVQSVGRVMRTFHKGQSDEKKYGYIIIPIVVPSNVPAEKALEDNKTYGNVWSILNALRSHDDRFNATVNSITLNKNKPQKIVIGEPGLYTTREEATEARFLEEAEVGKQLELRFGEWRDAIYAKLADKCGDRLYWENWAKDIGKIAQNFINRIKKLVDKEPYKKTFDNYLGALQRDINPSVDENQAIEMLAQHLITQPVFDALFADFTFVKKNNVSRSMQNMIDILKEKAFGKDTEELAKFYNSVKTTVGDIDNLEGKQTLIKTLYEKFFKGAFPHTTEQLGIVYTPVECVDFIIHSINDLLKEEFKTSLTKENVHILDPFVGTGTFITRLLQSGLIRPEDMERKYLGEIHCNEIVLLAYYVASVNIEAVFHDITQRKKYLPYEGICLTDTFQFAESKTIPSLEEDDIFKENSERINKLINTRVKVIFGNPPYSRTQNLAYPALEERIFDTYVREADGQNGLDSLYNSYIKAFRWATDKIPEDKGGIVAFISSGGWLDSQAGTGFRKCIERDFSSIYILNLRGNQLTKGERSRKEGGKIFGSGCRTSITITFLVKNPAKRGKKVVIKYHDIGDYLSREEKLKRLKEFRTLSNVKWKTIKPNSKGDWINQRDGVFDNLILIGDKKDTQQTLFSIYSGGVATHRDAFCYNSSKETLSQQMTSMIAFYNSQRQLRSKYSTEKDFLNALNCDTTKIKWDDKLLKQVQKDAKQSFSSKKIREAMYRPFFKQWLYYDNILNACTYQLPKLFPDAKSKNLIICGSTSSDGNFSCLISDTLPDLHLIGSSQCFPLYWYDGSEEDLFGSSSPNNYAITDWALKEFRLRLKSKKITNEQIFYYIYGVLHSEQYRKRFADDLSKSLPRLPIVESIDDFITFYKKGLELAELHLRYEERINEAATGNVAVAALPEILHEAYKVKVEGDIDIFQSRYTADTYKYFAVSKMRFAKGGRNDAGRLLPDKSTIIYNDRITIENIPTEAYDYIINGKSAIECIMERYAVTIDKKSQIQNDPNNWSKEHKQPRYILDLLLSIINLSCKTMEIVKSLPELDL